MSFWHKLFGYLMPSKMADFEAESRRWMVQCPACGYEISIWELGGIRYKAKSKGKWYLRRCKQCGKIKWHPVYYKKTEAAQGSGAASS
jgi:RNase P subunit RPR2